VLRHTKYLQECSKSILNALYTRVHMGRIVCVYVWILINNKEEKQHEIIKITLNLPGENGVVYEPDSTSVDELYDPESIIPPLEL